MTLKELMDLFYEHGNSFGMVRLYFNDRMETYNSEEILSTLGYRLGLSVKTWKYEKFDDSDDCIILDVYMRGE